MRKLNFVLFEADASGSENAQSINDFFVPGRNDLRVGAQADGREREDGRCVWEPATRFGIAEKGSDCDIDRNLVVVLRTCQHSTFTRYSSAMRLL